MTTSGSPSTTWATVAEVHGPMPGSDSRASRKSGVAGRSRTSRSIDGARRHASSNVSARRRSIGSSGSSPMPSRVPELGQAFWVGGEHQARWAGGHLTEAMQQRSPAPAGLDGGDLLAEDRGEQGVEHRLRAREAQPRAAAVQGAHWLALGVERVRASRADQHRRLVDRPGRAGAPGPDRHAGGRTRRPSTAGADLVHRPRSVGGPGGPPHPVLRGDAHAGLLAPGGEGAQRSAEVHRGHGLDDDGRGGGAHPGAVTRGGASRAR